MLRKAYVYVVILTMTLLTAGAEFNAFAQRPYRVTDRQVENVLITLERNADVFWRDFQVAIDRSAYNGTRTEDEVSNYIREFENATDRLRERFNARTSVSADVEEVLTMAANIDRFLSQYRFNTTVTRNWDLVKSDLNRLANFYNVSWNWNRTGFPTTGDTGYGNRPTRVNDAAVSSLLQTLERDTDYFNRTLTNALDRSQWNGTQTEDEIAEYVREFENATDRLRQNFGARNAAVGDVEEVLNRGAAIDNFLRQNRLPARVNNDWNRVRDDLTRLAGFYNVAWDWNRYNVPGRNDFPTGGTTYGSARLGGTYRLDTIRSANVEAEIDRAIADLPMNQRERVRRAALRRLEAPEYVAIERSGNQIRLASSKLPEVSFTADGRTRTETAPNGRSMSVSANAVGDQVVISYTGDRMNDYYVAFNPLRNGDEMRMTRRIYLEGVNRQITVENLYTRTSTIAQFDTVYRGDTTAGNYGGTTTSNADFVIPNGTRLTAVLNTDLDTKTANVGDRFTMEVTSPGEYTGAIIEGRVASVQRSGRVTGRASLGLDFDSIRLRNGSSYRFAGLVDSVAATDNNNVSITNEGQVREGDSQTNRTVTRTAIGAALGALIGAIAGGGEGAAIGAGVGAGAGAGSVILQGRDDLSLRQGSQITVTASAPRGVTNIR
ncbi:MAG: YMGG-like glycine zipper-containing protein [Acidobacteriota bacterium]|nr:YMGG-like glycine zipper-containing protein [Acidobacteriota bacterium]